MDNSEHQNTVNELNDKVNRLMKLYMDSKTENVQLQNENKQLKKELEQKNSELASFQEKFTNMELAKSIASGESTHDAKIKINRIVREIDKCIALLNK